MIIRDAQIEALKQIAVENFALDMMRHCREFSPHLAKTLSDEQLEAAVNEGISRAGKYGFNLRGPVRFYVDLMIVLGSGFDTDPQYVWAAEILTREDEDLSQMQRSEQLYEKTQEFLEKVDGEENVHTRKALKDLRGKIQSGLTFHRGTFEPDLLALMKEIHPKKYEETGEESLKKLIHDGKEKGRKQYGFNQARSVGLVVVLNFAFGHHFDKDPFLPWISRTLEKDGFETPEKKAEELERRALIWLDAVLKNAEKEDKK